MQDVVAPAAPQRDRSGRLATGQQLHTGQPPGAHAERSPVVIGPALLTGAIDKASVAVDALEQTGSRLAIAVDGMIVSAPIVHEAITGGQARITMGGAGTETTAVLAAVLSTPPLPAPVTVEAVHLP